MAYWRGKRVSSRKKSSLPAKRVLLPQKRVSRPYFPCPNTASHTNFAPPLITRSSRLYATKQYIFPYHSFDFLAHARYNRYIVVENRFTSIFFLLLLLCILTTRFFLYRYLIHYHDGFPWHRSLSYRSGKFCVHCLFDAFSSALLFPWMIMRGAVSNCVTSECRHLTIILTLLSSPPADIL